MGTRVLMELATMLLWSRPCLCIVVDAPIKVQLSRRYAEVPRQYCAVHNDAIPEECREVRWWQSGVSRGWSSKLAT